MSAHRMLVIPVEGPVRVVVEVGGLRLAHLQAAVGGYIEAVNVTRILTDTGMHRLNCTLFCNEEGKLHDLPLNRRATDLAALSLMPPPDDMLEARHVIRISPPEWYGWIAGDAIVLGPVDPEGNETDVPNELIQLVAGWKWMGKDVTP